MIILKHPLFIISILVALSIYIAQRLHLALPNWISFYVNDFLCMPIALSLCLVVVRRIKTSTTLYLPMTAIFFLTVYFAIHFEWLMPKLSTRYTFDIIDIMLYSLGSLLFFFFQKRLF